MIVQSFRSVMWVGAVAGAALSCYMVSLRVASERAALERVESRILMAKRDIRSLDTELSTRGRLRQLERWNVDVLALSPPTEGQFLTGEVQLASLSAPSRDMVAGPVMLASAEVRKPKAKRGEPLPTDAAPRTRNPLLVQASAPKSVLADRVSDTDEADRPEPRARKKAEAKSLNKPAPAKKNAPPKTAKADVKKAAPKKAEAKKPL